MTNCIRALTLAVPGWHDIAQRVYSLDGPSPTVNACSNCARVKILVEREGSE